ncbi:MHJ_0274 family protein [Mycoplasma struthionis]|uniref:DUF4760 domain-containing protein n=1 Tax=Mycoplasma struthionis TaxID=538220 RepID=A0A3G8LGP3_9MOLU|nr:hypothetical protein [Mycoplasma struthionis]AZG68836.1 hypothetical protein EGN60_02645 [Mycoplasma struthionis]TPI01500.1 hypothetical protein FJM01_02530 [Mycoplasma struthionis]
MNYLNLAEETALETQTGSSQTGQIAAYVLLSLIILAVIGYIIWKIIRSRIMKKKTKLAEQKREQKIQNLYFEYIATINEIIRYTEKELENFQVSIGQVKMGQIKQGAYNLLFKLISRDDFASSFISNDIYKDFVLKCEILTATPCNLWKTKASEVLEFFKDQEKLITETEEVAKSRALAKKSIEEKFYE